MVQSTPEARQLVKLVCLLLCQCRSKDGVPRWYATHGFDQESIPKCKQESQVLIHLVPWCPGPMTVPIRRDDDGYQCHDSVSVATRELAHRYITTSRCRPAQRPPRHSRGGLEPWNGLGSLLGSPLARPRPRPRLSVSTHCLQVSPITKFLGGFDSRGSTGEVPHALWCPA